MQLSQRGLTLLATCLRQFQHVYLDQLSLPISPEQQQRLNWGSWFHLLMQRRELGLDSWSDTANEFEQQLQNCVESFVATVPHLFPAQPQPPSFRQSECRQTLYFQGHLLVAIYDLLILEPDRAEILDWKTYSLHKADQLQQSWQTRLYLFILAETSHYAPEQLSMTYWFIHPQASQPQFLRMTYNQDLHQQTAADLEILIQQLDQSIASEMWPQVASTDPCETCPFANRCLRSQGVALPELAEMAEVVV